VLTVNYAKPVITRQPTSQQALRFGNITLVCEAASSSDSVLTVRWKKDNQVRHYTVMHKMSSFTFFLTLA